MTEEEYKNAISILIKDNELLRDCRAQSDAQHAVWQETMDEHLTILERQVAALENIAIYIAGFVNKQ